MQCFAVLGAFAPLREPAVAIRCRSLQTLAPLRENEAIGSDPHDPLHSGARIG
jgi:hypothetical protein